MEGGSSRRNGIWSFTIAISSGFKAAATRVATATPWPGCGSANWSRAGAAPDRRTAAARIVLLRLRSGLGRLALAPGRATAGRPGPAARGGAGRHDDGPGGKDAGG